MDLLERLVDLAPGEEGKSVEDVLKDLERVEREMGKTLPKLPIPSGKKEGSKKVSNVPRASVVFGLQAPKGRFEKAKEDKSKKSVLRPSPMARRISTHEMDREQVNRSHDEGDVAVGGPISSSEQHPSGLDALERRLLLEVGTRKPDAPDRPTIFELGIAMPIPAVPRSNSAFIHPETGDSEISSLALTSNDLTSNDSTDIYLPKAGKRLTPTSTPIYGPPVLRMDGEENKMERSAGTATADKAQPLAARKDLLKEEKNKEQEAIKLRKAAKGRVADWLGGVAIRPSPDEADHGPNSRSLRGTGGTEKMSPFGGSSSDKISANVPIPSLPATLIHKSDDVPANTKKPRVVSVPPLMASPSAGPKSLLEPHKQNVLHGRPLSNPAATSALSAASASASPKVPSPVSSRHRKPVPPLDESIPEESQSVSTPAPEPEKAAGHSAKLPLLQGIPETKYDVRSARGGKGGITTSVAALWTSLAQEGGKDNQAKHPTKPVTRKAVTHPAFLDVGKTKPSTAFTGAPPGATSDNTPRTEPSTKQPPQPRNVVKSASVPAIVVPSHARPYLSSTASLAHPIETLFSKAKPPMLSSTLSSSDTSYKVPPVIPRDIAFGQTRLKDLIKKYQQSTS